MQFPVGAFGSVDTDAAVTLVDGLFVAISGRLFPSSAADPALPADSQRDAAALGRAYRAWGPEFPERLDGNYAFALWDPAKGQLVLGRDVIGQEPLHYAVVGETLLFASEPRGLIGWMGVGEQIDRETLLRNMIMQPDGSRTLFTGIRSLRSGHTLVARSADALHTSTYWRPLRKGFLHLADPREYAVGLRSALDRAVSVRLPGEGSVGSMLSSGFDSSAVTALLARQLAVHHRPLLAFTSAPGHEIARAVRPGRFADEWPLAARVAAGLPNVTHLRIDSSGGDWWAAMDASTDAWGGPPVFLRNFRWFHAVLAAARQRGVTTLFEGSAGNLTGSYDGVFGLFDLRRRGDLPGLLRAVRSRRSRGAGWKSIAHMIWMPSAAMLQRIRKLSGNWKPNRLRDVILVRPEAFRAAGIDPDAELGSGLASQGDRRSGPHWRFHILQRIDMGMTNAAYRRLYGIERMDPTADRQLIEFCLSIPDERFSPGGVPRQLYRMAMEDILPPEILQESRRGLQAGDFLESFGKWVPAFRAEIDRLASSSDAASLLDLDRLSEMLDRWPQEVSADPVRADDLYNFSFGGALTAGRFLRRVDDGSFYQAMRSADTV